MTGLRAYHRANSNTEANTIKAGIHENESDIESDDFAPSKNEKQCMNQPPVPKVLHDQAQKWTPNESAFSEDAYPASSSSSSPGPWQNHSLATPAPATFPVCQPQAPGFTIFIQLIENLNTMELTSIPYWFEANRFIDTLKQYGMDPLVESIFTTTLFKWFQLDGEIKKEWKNSIVHGAGLDRIVRELVAAIRKHPEKFGNKRKLDISYDLLRIGYSLKKPHIADIINECKYDNNDIVPLEEVMLFCKNNFSHYLVRAIRPDLKKKMINSAACWLGASNYPFTWPEYDLILLTKTLGDYICSDEFSSIGLETTIPEIFININISPNGRHPDGRLLTIHWLDAFHRVFGKRDENNEMFRAIVTRCATVLMGSNFETLSAKDWSCIIRACKRFSNVRAVGDLLFRLADHIPSRDPNVRDILLNFIALDSAGIYSTKLRNYVAGGLSYLASYNNLVICDCRALRHTNACYGVKTNELLDAVDIICNSDGFVDRSVHEICQDLTRSQSVTSQAFSF